MKGLSLFYHTHAIDGWMKYLFMKSKNMYSPLTLDFGKIDFWSTSLPPISHPPLSQLRWFQRIFAWLFKCLLGPNFSSQTLFIWFCWKHENSSGHFFVACTQNWSQGWPLRIFEVFTFLAFLWMDNIWVITNIVRSYVHLFQISHRRRQGVALITKTSMNSYFYHCISCWLSSAVLVFLLSSVTSWFLKER